MYRTSLISFNYPYNRLDNPIKFIIENERNYIFISNRPNKESDADQGDAKDAVNSGVPI